MLGLEIFFTVLLILIVRLSLIGQLWDQSYLDIVIEDWWQYPIIDIKGYAATKDDEAVCPSDYELVGYGYFDGTKDACNCPGKPLQYETCTEDQLKASCQVIQGKRESQLPVVNNKFYCAKRDTSYNFMTMEKP